MNKRTIYLMNYENKPFPIEIDPDRLEAIYITILSGDEVADILYAGGGRIQVDTGLLSDNPRMLDFFDGAYILFSKVAKINRFEEFLKRKNPYDMDKFVSEDQYLYGDDEDEDEDEDDEGLWSLACGLI